jgi:nickel-dependent lactate racemase
MKIDYGQKGLELSLNPLWNITVLHPEDQKSFADPVGRIRDAIKNPLGSEPLSNIVKQKNNLNQVCVVVSDSTRPVPSQLILDALIKELNEYGIQNHQILILIATGLQFF